MLFAFSIDKTNLALYPESQTKYPGEKVVIKCMINGSVKFKFKRKGGKLEKAKTVLDKNDGLLTLVIDKANKNHDGTYVCIGKTRNGYYFQGSSRLIIG